MRVFYKQLFSVECLHGYFADHVCKALTLRPTAECERLLQRYRLLFRSATGGGAVYYTQEADVDFLRLFREVTPFAFTLSSSDPLLEIYTQSEFGANSAPSETIHYFSNAEGQVSEVNGKPRLLLHPPEKPFAQPPLPVRPAVFTHRFDQPLRGVRLQISDALLDRPVWQAQTPAQETRSWTIDLRSQPEGRYLLRVGGKAALNFYLANTPAVKQWGVVEIFGGGPDLAQHIPKNCQVIDAAGLPHARTFTVSLAERATLWRYYIFDQSQKGSPYESCQVVGVSKRSGGADQPDGREIRFTRKAETVTVHGRRAFVFESEQAVPLCEFPTEEDYVFTFRANGRNERGGRSVKLPVAQASATKLDATADGARMCSEIFVYL